MNHYIQDHTVDNDRLYHHPYTPPNTGTNKKNKTKIFGKTVLLTVRRQFVKSKVNM